MRREAGKTLSVQSWTSASALLLGVTGFSKLLGFLRELLLASYFGASGQVDAYAVAYAIPLFLAGGIGYAFSTAIIPGYHRRVAECGAEAGIQFLTTSCISSLLWSLIFLSPVWGMPKLLVRIAAPSMSETTTRLTIDLMGWLALYVLLLNMVYVLSAVFHAFNHFRLPTASELLFNVVAIGLFVTFVSLWGIRALVIGSLAGISSCVVLLMVALLRASGELHLRALYPAELVRPLLACLPVAAYYLASQFPGLLANYFASGLGEGSIAAFGYARTVLVAVVTLTTLSLARGLFPTFASLSASGKMEEFRQLIVGMGKLVVFVFVPLSTLAVVYREVVPRLLYQRGAFDEAALVLTATAFGCLALSLTFAAWEPVGTRALYASGDMRSPLLVTVGSACLVVPLLLVLTPVLGLGGVALSLSLALAADGALQVFCLGRRLDSSIWPDLMSFFAQCATCALLAGMIFIFLPRPHLGELIGGVTLYLALYSVLAWTMDLFSLRAIVSSHAAR